MKSIKKVSQFATIVGKILNLHSDSKIDSYSCDYINNIFKVYTHTSNTPIQNQWGNVYISDDITVDISSLGLKSTPKVWANLRAENTAIAIVRTVTKNEIVYFLMKPTSTSANLPRYCDFMIVKN